jgi:hypothetical protein
MSIAMVRRSGVHGTRINRKKRNDQLELDAHGASADGSRSCQLLNFEIRVYLRKLYYFVSESPSWALIVAASKNQRISDTLEKLKAARLFTDIAVPKSLIDSPTLFSPSKRDSRLRFEPAADQILKGVLSFFRDESAML